jgi:hypothetical protein
VPSVISSFETVPVESSEQAHATEKPTKKTLLLLLNGKMDLFSTVQLVNCSLSKSDFGDNNNPRVGDNPKNSTGDAWQISRRIRQAAVSWTATKPLAMQTFVGSLSSWLFQLRLCCALWAFHLKVHSLHGYSSLGSAAHFGRSLSPQSSAPVTQAAPPAK